MAAIKYEIMSHHLLFPLVAGGSPQYLQSLWYLIYLKLNNSGKVDNRKKNQAEPIFASKVQDHVEEISFAEISDNNPVNEKNSQALIVKHVLNKANNDSDFWHNLLEKSSEIISKFNLSREAKAAIASGDVLWVHANVGHLPEKQMAFLYSRLEQEVW